MTDDPIEPDFADLMTRVAAALDAMFNPDGERTVGFMLLVAPFGDHRTNYISNVDRDDARKLMAELIARWEEGTPE